MPNSVKGSKPEKEQNFQNNLSQDPEADKEDIDEEKLVSINVHHKYVKIYIY